MTFWLALRRLLPLLAVLSLALTPVTAPAATAGMHAAMPAAVHDHHGHAMPDMGMADDGSGHVDMADMAMDDMPCCPHEKAARPDCAKGCPLMALCLRDGALARTMFSLIYAQLHAQFVGKDAAHRAE